jgi:hypothetical protein
MLPLGLVIINLFPAELFTQGVFMALVASAGLGGILNTIARDMGSTRDRQLTTTLSHTEYRDLNKDKLFSRSHLPDPTVAILLFQEFVIPDHHRKEEFTQLLHKVIPTFPANIWAIESESHGKAVCEIKRALAKLKEITRDHQKFPLLREELINYSTRRKLWRMKNYALWALFFSITALCYLAGVKTPHIQDYTLQGLWLSVKPELLRVVDAPPMIQASLLLCLTLLGLWVFVVRRIWVWRAEKAYATRLLSSLYILEREMTDKR